MSRGMSRKVTGKFRKKTGNQPDEFQMIFFHLGRGDFFHLALLPLKQQRNADEFRDEKII